MLEKGISSGGAKQLDFDPLFLPRQSFFVVGKKVVNLARTFSHKEIKS
jgi:hypothetical protein